jgi:GNAT superfamily N-acetyltransferase
MDASRIDLRVGGDIPLDELVALYDAVGWSAYTAPERVGDLQRALRNSTYLVTAWHGEQLVGLARGISDDVAVFYLQDILVRPSHQRRGIGARLLRNCLERFDHVRLHILLTDDDEATARFYEACGFADTGDLRRHRLHAFVRMPGIDLG